MDKTAPTCGTTWNPTEAPWSKDNTQLFTVTANSDTGGSGMSATSFQCTAPATNGATCNAVISDNVGNTANCTSPPNRIDTTPPTVSIDVTGGTTSGSVYTATPTITVSGDDTDSGLAGVKHVWLSGDGSGIATIVGGATVGGSEATTAQNCNSALATIEFYTTNSFAIPDDGTFTLCAKSYDNVGNASTIATQTFTLFSDDIVFIDGFNTLNNACNSMNVQYSCIYNADEGGEFTLTGNLLADPTAPTNLKICFEFTHVNRDVNPVCTTVTTSTSASSYTFNIPTSLLPDTRDVFLSTVMTTTDLANGNTHTQNEYFILNVKRPTVTIVPTTRLNTFIHVRNGALNSI
jgi:hypothetical protein